MTNHWMIVLMCGQVQSPAKLFVILYDVESEEVRFGIEEKHSLVNHPVFVQDITL